MPTWIYIGIGGFLGANARYYFTIMITNCIGGVFPYGTLFVNFTGSLLLAAFIGWTTHQLSLPDNLKLLIGTGFFGAYTTFSTFANESVALFQHGYPTAALGNLIGTNLLCLLGVIMGLLLANRLFTA